MIRVAILGADSSHTETYLELLNGPDAPFGDRARAVSLWGEDPEEARRKATGLVEVAETPAEAIGRVDVVMVCSRWGDDHFAPARVALAAGVPTYIDKPLTNRLDEAQDLEALASAKSVPAFSCSPFRFAREVEELREVVPSLGEFRFGTCTGLAEWPALGPRATRLPFYGVHSAELLHAIFGPGAEAIRVERAPNVDIVSVRYPDGRRIAWHLLRGCAEVYRVAYYGAEAWAERAITTDSGVYERTLGAVLTMAETGRPPIPLGYAVEIIALLDAVTRAKDGDWVSLGRSTA